MPLTPEEKAERARERMLQKAKEYSTGTYIRRNVAPVFQKMIRAEFGAQRHQFQMAVVDGEFRAVQRELGQCACVTCGRVVRWNGRDIQTGHFLASRCNSILFEETNVAPQCSHCNGYRGGMPQEYRLWMRMVRGPEAIERLERLKTESRSFGREELVDLRIAYAARLAAAEERMKEGP